MIRKFHYIASKMDSTVLAFCLVVFAAALFALMHNVIRYVTTSEGIHPFEAAFFRNLFGVLLFAPWIIKNGFSILRTARPFMHIARAGLNSISLLAWFTALSLMPVADATALGLLSPVFVTILAIIFLSETVGIRRWIGVFIALLGGLIIVRPGFSEIGLGTWLILFAALTVSSSKLMAKVLSNTESAGQIVGLLTLLMLPITLLPAIFVWKTPDLYQLMFLALIGFFGVIGHLLFVQAYKLADISVVEPAIFTRMIWAALIGYIMFSEFPDLWTWIGGGIIVIGTTYIARREAIRGEERVPVSDSRVGD